MLTKANFAMLLCLTSVTVGHVMAQPDDPYASLAAAATSYEEFVHHIVAAAPKVVPPPVPSPIVSTAEQEAFLDALNVTTTGPKRLMARDSESLTKSAYVANPDLFTFPYQGPDAGSCVSYLAGLGETECRVGVNGVLMCLHHKARIVRLARRGEAASSCANVARAAGRILDVCTHSDHQVTGQKTLDSDENFNVIVDGS
ncbi:uncharacterized protein PG986_004816 [Apiospora aurea]|uniref:Uncharacterized protein n=1 Tax=Apiospora aurea TaxID=335848 RepID=A0ABR1QNN5_9PEZI